MNIKYEDAKKVYKSELMKFYGLFDRYKTFDNSKPIMSVLYGKNWKRSYRKLEELKNSFNEEGHFSRVIEPPKLIIIDKGFKPVIRHTGSQSVQYIKASNLYQLTQIIMSQKAPYDDKKIACNKIEALCNAQPELYKYFSFRKFGSGYYFYFCEGGERKTVSIGTGLVVNCEYKEIKRSYNSRNERSDKKELFGIGLLCSNKGYLYCDVM